MDQIWWGRVPNAISFINDIADNLLDEKSIILHYKQDVPWYETMVQQVKELVMQQNSSKRFEVIHSVDDPGPYLLHEFCKPEKRASYRPTKKFSTFFAESDDIVLHARYLWVYIESLESLSKWTEFISEYVKCRKKDKENAAFILEWSGEKPANARKGIRLLSFDDYISDYDRIVFSTLAASGTREDTRIKNYLTELAANIAGNDFELSAACVSEYKDFLRDPYSVICKIIGTQYRSNGDNYIYDSTEKDVSYYIWQAQIKTIYPLIEEYRGTFVSKHANAIMKELPISSSYGEVYDDPANVELGTLVFMAVNGCLYLNNNEYSRLKMFKDARNMLSHLNTLSIEEIRNLLQ